MTNNQTPINAAEEHPPNNLSPIFNSSGGTGHAYLRDTPMNSFENPMDEMVRRWKQIIEKSLPAIDLIDLAAEHDYFYSNKRQFAPEYSQSAYLTMLANEYAIGDYIDFR